MEVGQKFDAPLPVQTVSARNSMTYTKSNCILCVQQIHLLKRRRKCFIQTIQLRKPATMTVSKKLKLCIAPTDVIISYQLSLRTHSYTVLCGRGNRVNFHKGNEYFRKLVASVRNEYVATPKPEKPKFAKLVQEHIRSLNPPGRFLKRSSESEPFTDIGEKDSIDKTSQALREGKPKIEAQIKSGEIVIQEVSSTVVFFCQSLYSFIAYPYIFQSVVRHENNHRRTIQKNLSRSFSRTVCCCCLGIFSSRSFFHSRNC